MPGKTSPVRTTAITSSDEESCDDPSGSLILSSASFDEEEAGRIFRPHSGSIEDVFEVTPMTVDDLANNWDPSLYTLQTQAPKPKPVRCDKLVSERPLRFGSEFHGYLSRKEAALVLGLEDGCYLVRESLDEPGHYVLSFNLGRMWNYRLLFEDGKHYVGDKRFEVLSELVEDGLITLFMQNHIDIMGVMQKGRALTRRKTQQRLRRQPCRRIKRSTPRRSESSEPSSPHSPSLSSPSSLSSASDSDSTPADPFTPPSDHSQSDLDFLPSRANRLSPAHLVRQNATNSEPHVALCQRRAKSSSAVCSSTKRISAPNPLSEGRYSPIYALRDAVRADRSDSLSVSVSNKASTLDDPQITRSMSYDTKRSHSTSAGSLERLVKALHTKEHKSLTVSSCPYYKAHKFSSHTYKSPTWCEMCHHFMWGLSQQGLKCSDCGLDAHKQCLVGAMGTECKPTKKMVKRVFGVELTTLLKVEGTSIPTVMEECIKELEKRGLSEEGIYRLSGQVSEVLELKEKWDAGEHPDLAAYEDSNVIAGALKLFLRELPIPLVTFDTYSDIIRASAEINDPSDPAVDWDPLSGALKLLPKAHYHVLKFFVEHLKLVDDMSLENRMTVQNLAVVFAPTLMRCPNNDVSAIRDIPIQKNCIECLILKSDVLFG